MKVPGGPGRRIARRSGPRRAKGLPNGPDEVRRAVLDAAAELFAEHGVAHVSLREVAGSAQVNVGLISRYIGTRDDLIVAVFEDLTARLVAEIEAAPLDPRGFEQASTMVRWTRVLAYLVVTDTDTAIEVGKCPVRNLIEVVARVYGQDHRSASLRVAQVMGSAIGWRLFEPYLVASAGLDDMPLTEVRLELTRIHRWIGATPYPSPPDPPMLT